MAFALCEKNSIFAPNSYRMNGKTPHIVQYQGSKRLLAPQILRYLPDKFNRLIEPFAGMAAISIAASQSRRADRYILNDINEPLVRVLQSAIESPRDLLDNYSSLWNEQFSFDGGSVAHFYKVRDDFNKGKQSAEVMLYLLARCVKGSVRYGSNGNFNQSPDKRRYGTRPSTLKSNLFKISYYLKGCTDFFACDYKDILLRAKPGDIVYMDPPYQGVTKTGDSRYCSRIDFEGFVEALDSLNRRGIDFLVSYDGQCGTRQYGRELPKELMLKKVLLNAGVSAQSTLLGKRETTYEALYISRGLQADFPVLQTAVLCPTFNTLAI